MATHFPLQLIAVVLMALSFGVAGAQEIAPAPKPVPSADDLLEQARLRQRVADEKATADVFAVEVQVGLVYLVSPTAARGIAAKIRDDIAANPDLSETCRTRLVERLGRLARD